MTPFTVPICMIRIPVWPWPRKSLDGNPVASLDLRRLLVLAALLPSEHPNAFGNPRFILVVSAAPRRSDKPIFSFCVLRHSCFGSRVRERCLTRIQPKTIQSNWVDLG